MSPLGLQQQQLLPQVTISSHEGASLVEYNPFGVAGTTVHHPHRQHHDLAAASHEDIFGGGGRGSPIGGSGDHSLFGRCFSSTSSQAAMDSATHSSSSSFSLLRAGRSHSLTPSVPGGGQRPASATGVVGYGGSGGFAGGCERGPKMRSNSLTLGPGGMIAAAAAAEGGAPRTLDDFLARPHESSSARGE